MSVQGPDHAFYVPDAADASKAALAWAPRAKRRGLVLGALAVFAGLSVGLALTLNDVLSMGPVSPNLMGWGAFTLAFALLAIWIDRMLFKATRPAFALPGELYDERQAHLNDTARRSARWISYVAIAGLTLLGAVGASTGVIVAAGLCGFGLVMSGQQLVLAWTLEAEDFEFGDDA